MVGTGPVITLITDSKKKTYKLDHVVCMLVGYGGYNSLYLFLTEKPTVWVNIWTGVGMCWNVMRSLRGGMLGQEPLMEVFLSGAAPRPPLLLLFGLFRLPWGNIFLQHVSAALCKWFKKSFTDSPFICYVLNLKMLLLKGFWRHFEYMELWIDI